MPTCDAPDCCPTCGQQLPQRVAPIVVDPYLKIVRIADKWMASYPRRLASPRVLEVLQILSNNYPRIVSRDLMMKSLYGSTGTDDPDWKVLDVYVNLLRRLLCGSGWGIRTAWGKGWSLVDYEVGPRASNAGGKRKNPELTTTPEIGVIWSTEQPRTPLNGRQRRLLVPNVESSPHSAISEQTAQTDQPESRQIVG